MLLLCLKNDNYFVLESSGISSGSSTEILMVLYNHDMKEIQKLMINKEEDPRSIAKINGIKIDRPTHLWAISRGKIYVGNKDKSEYEILVYDYEGNLLRKIRKEYSPVEVPESFKRKVLRPYEENSNVIIRDIAKKIYFPKSLF